MVDWRLHFCEGGVKLTGRQRVLTALAHKEPDRVPFAIKKGNTPGFEQKFYEKTGSRDPSEYFDTDERTIEFESPGGLDKYRAFHSDRVERFNDWGVGFIRGSMHHFDLFIPSLDNAADIKELEDYPLPDYYDKRCWEHLEKEVTEYHARDLAVSGFLEMTMFEVAWQIRGIENFLMDLYFKPDWVELLLDRILEIRLFMAEKLTRVGVDVLKLGDDIGTQHGMMIPVKQWRQFFKPRLTKIIQHVKKLNPSIYIFYHSDGNVAEVIPDLMDAGIDILNPIQPECLDPVMVKSRYGNKLTLWGTIGTQSVLPFGTLKDVEENVKERLNTLKAGGGLVLEPTHVIEPEVPVENLIAYVEAVKTHGYY